MGDMKDNEFFGLTPDTDAPSITVVHHPLIKHKLTLMRRAACPSDEFRRIMREMGVLMGCAATSQMKIKAIEDQVMTPLGEKAPGWVLALNHAVIVPIIRSGLILAEGLQELMPRALIGHIGLHQNPENIDEIIEYMVKLPTPQDRHFFLADPVIATGGSARHAIRILRNYAVPEEHITFVSVVASRTGATKVHEEFGNVRIYVAAIDEGLTPLGFISPGLGDVGARLFGTLEV